MSDLYDTKGPDELPLVTIHDICKAELGMPSRRKGCPKVEHS